MNRLDKASSMLKLRGHLLPGFSLIVSNDLIERNRASDALHYLLGIYEGLSHVGDPKAPGLKQLVNDLANVLCEEVGA